MILSSELASLQAKFSHAPTLSPVSQSCKLWHQTPYSLTWQFWESQINVQVPRLDLNVCDPIYRQYWKPLTFWGIKHLAILNHILQNVLPLQTCTWRTGLSSILWTPGWIGGNILNNDVDQVMSWDLVINTSIIIYYTTLVGIHNYKSSRIIKS